MNGSEILGQGWIVLFRVRKTSLDEWNCNDRSGGWKIFESSIDRFCVMIIWDFSFSSTSISAQQRCGAAMWGHVDNISENRSWAGFFRPRPRKMRESEARARLCVTTPMRPKNAPEIIVVTVMNESCTCKSPNSRGNFLGNHIMFGRMHFRNHMHWSRLSWCNTPEQIYVFSLALDPGKKHNSKRKTYISWVRLGEISLLLQLIFPN